MSEEFMSEKETESITNILSGTTEGDDKPSRAAEILGEKETSALASILSHANKSQDPTCVWEEPRVEGKSVLEWVDQVLDRIIEEESLDASLKEKFFEYAISKALSVNNRGEAAVQRIREVAKKLSTGRDLTESKYKRGQSVIVSREDDFVLGSVVSSSGDRIKIKTDDGTIVECTVDQVTDLGEAEEQAGEFLNQIEDGDIDDVIQKFLE